ncbi:hypothetical protein C1645_818686 [Glomus cerebriforme]|uniref:Uncharacterized protein n=1 Tax=Glomus cerebriforme TaxID=658196 RepID=A0A397T838_9GLOM|nr:hypothetical protein C1645_818686 [Glomus cerebriforme]
MEKENTATSDMSQTLPPYSQYPNPPVNIYFQQPQQQLQPQIVVLNPQQPPPPPQVTYIQQQPAPPMAPIIVTTHRSRNLTIWSIVILVILTSIILPILLVYGV